MKPSSTASANTCETKPILTALSRFGLCFKRGYYGTYHKMSEKHLARYIGEFAGRHNAHAVDTIQRMALMAQGMMGKRLRYRELIADA